MDSTHKKVVQTLKSKSCLKQDIFSLTKDVFASFKQNLSLYAEALRKEVCVKDDRIKIEFKDSGEYACELAIAGDILVFVMHTNVFQFESSHDLWQTSYLKKDVNRGYCGTIHMYNFLADSFRYQRMNDIGYMIGRLFVNKDRHFFVQGKRPLGLLFNDFMNSKLTDEKVQEVIEAAVLYTLDFDLYTPPFQDIQLATVQEMQEIGKSMFITTGKRVGYKFQTDNDDFE
jgi:hypothetical protein